MDIIDAILMLGTFKMHALLFLGFFLIAAFYSSVGFGGGSSYLALLSLFAFSFLFIRSNALLCNLVVVSGSTIIYYQNKHFNFKRFFPFILTSVPMAFSGALFRLDEKVFFILLGFTLLLSSLALIYQSIKNKTVSTKSYSNYFSYILGALIGLLSGLVGIGGGIFLAPVLHYFKWGKAYEIAALTAFFILVNSIAGLTGLMVNDTLRVSFAETSLLILAVFLGGQFGIRYSIKINAPNGIRAVTAILVFIVAIRILITKGFA